MKRLVCLTYLMFVVACDIPPAWDGNPASCDAIVEGACLRGLAPADLEEMLPLSASIFGPINIEGYLIEVVPQTSCSGKLSSAEGCQYTPTRIIQIKEQSAFCRRWILAHELGHVAIHDPGHNDDRWGTLYMDYYWPICDPRYQ